MISSVQPREGERLGDKVEEVIQGLYDGMTECIYQQPLSSFWVDAKPQPVFEVDVLAKGRTALEEANDQLGRRSLMVTWVGGA